MAQMNQKIIISSVANFIALLSSNPTLQDLPAFKNVLPGLKNTKPKVGGCGGCRNKSIPENRQLFENAIVSLSSGEKQEMKAILSANQICYYTLVNQRLTLHCF